MSQSEAQTTSQTPNSPISSVQAAQELLSRRQARTSLQSFIEYLDLGFVPAAHHKLLIQNLEAVERGEVTKLMVLMPPGSAKSTYTSVLFPPWYLGRHQDDAVLAVSNSLDLAERFSRRARNIVSSPRYANVFGVSLAEDSQSAGSWELGSGGEFFAAGIGTAIAGRRADLGLIDDPIKSREEADSERLMEKQWDWYVNDFTTRLKPGARQVLIQTRWSEKDLGGRLLEREGDQWKVVKLPMEAVQNDPLGRKPGERLWPEWFTHDMVTEAKRRDERTWSALYQQEPSPEEGTYFKRAWFNEYTFLPPDLHVYGASDYAVSGGDGDYTVHGIFGIDFNGSIYVLDWWKQQTTSDVWIDAQCDLIAKYYPLIWFGESGPIRKAIEPFLKGRMIQRQTPCRLEWLPSINDKITRARAIQAKASMGDLNLPQDALWKADLIHEWLQFPAGKYDDGVDVLSLLGRGLEKTQLPTVKRKTEAKASVSRGAQGWMT